MPTPYGGTPYTAFNAPGYAVPPPQGYPGFGSPLFDPTANYGWGGDPNWLGGVVGDIMIQQNPEAYYTYATGGAGLGRNPFGAYVKSMFPDVMRGYGAAQLQNPQLRLPQYMASRVSDLYKSFNEQPFQLRQESPRAWGAGAGRWMFP